MSAQSYNQIKVLIPRHQQVESKSGHQFVLYSLEVYYLGKCHRIQRRYRDFHSFHKRFKKLITTPEFPPKKVRNNLSQKFVEQRRETLEKYLQESFEMKLSHSKQFIYYLISCPSRKIYR